MRRLSRICALLLLALVAAAAPAQESPPAEMPDVPAGEAVLRGQVLHSDRTEAAAGDVEVVLYSLGRDGQPGVRRTRTDATGAFRFEGIAASPDTAYLLGARYAGLAFPGDRVVFAENERERVVEIRISEPSEDASTIEVEQSSLRVEWLGDRLAIGEVHRLANRGRTVYHVPPERRAGREAPLHAELPAGATAFSMPLGLVPEGVERTGRDFRFWGPLYPGEQEVSFRYELPVAAGLVEIEKRFPSAADRVRVFGREGGLLEAAEGLERREPVEDEGIRFLPFEREPAPAGLVTVLRLRIPESTRDPSVASLVESQVIMEIDDVALSVREQHQLEVAGAAAVDGANGEPIMEFTLPAAAEDVRFSADASSLGLVRTDAGIGLMGPLAPGNHVVGLAYSLRTGSDGVSFTRRFDRRLPLLRVFVADTGVAVETDRLHRRRPVRDADRTYLLFEAFELEANEPLAFSLRALPPRAGSRAPALVLAILTGVVAAVFLVWPLGSEDAAEEEASAAESATRREREALYETIRDLDHDHETGKLDPGDWERLRAELRAEAVALLARERRATTPAPAPPAPVACPACTAPVGAEARFCSRCGVALVAPGADEPPGQPAGSDPA